MGDDDVDVVGSNDGTAATEECIDENGILSDGEEEEAEEEELNGNGNGFPVRQLSVGEKKKHLLQSPLALSSTSRRISCSPSSASSSAIINPRPGCPFEKTFMEKINPVIITSACIACAAFVGIVGPKLARGGDGYVNYVLPAAPCFMIMILLELFLATLTKYKSQAAHHDWADSWGSMSAGSSQMVILTFVASTVEKLIAPYFGYNVVWNNYALGRLDADAWSTWVISLAAFDFTFYWAHRFGHTSEIFWAGHKVHHSSERYNLTTALRQSWFQGVCTLAMPLPFAFFIPPKVFFTTSAWNIIYQFWVHTCLVDRLGFFEWFLSTPSHHRIHHDRRLHKNYGGILIIWDRLFGTFMDEYDSLRHHNYTRGREEIVLFGVQKVVSTWLEPPLQLTSFMEIWDRMKKKWNRGDSLASVLLVPIIGPGYYTTLKHRIINPPQNEDTRIRLKRPLSSFLPSRIYFVAQFVETVTMSVVIAFFASSVSMSTTVFLTAYYLLVVSTIGLYLDKHHLHYVVHALKVIISLGVFLPHFVPLVIHDASEYAEAKYGTGIDTALIKNIVFTLLIAHNSFGLLLQLAKKL
eukprot:m.23248 g.23248  ORF g.23248 m.23248 type:complete len:580 (+) comp5533_c0_seq1:23-1762(+)